MEYIKVKVRAGTTDGQRMKSATIHSIESSCGRLNTFEFPKLMHALSISRGLIKEKKGFPYTFPFNFGGVVPPRPSGFPYVLPLKLS